jgi:hypothetical protein
MSSTFATLRYLSTTVTGWGNYADTQTEIHIDANNQYYEVSTYPSGDAGPSGTSKALEKAEINLNDCLACRWVQLLSRQA